MAPQHPSLSEARPVHIWRANETAVRSLLATQPELLSKHVLEHQCFFNAHFLACHFPSSVEYVEGFVIFHDSVIPHAWNAILGRHFDATWELHFEAALAQPHLALVQGRWPSLERQGYVFEPHRRSLVEQSGSSIP